MEWKELVSESEDRVETEYDGNDSNERLLKRYVGY